MTDKKTISAYDSQVDNYVDIINQQPIDSILLGFIDRFESNDYVLDLGCGPAISSATMREHGLRVDPTDASKEMVKLANDTFDSLIVRFLRSVAETSCLVHCELNFRSCVGAQI